MYEIPAERLPPGFGDTLEDPPDPPAEPSPAATTVLLRDGQDALEVLLMQRHRRSGFVPGAWVFPGGRVDPADADPDLGNRLVGLGADPEPPRPFWAAAIRELFEETGVLLARERSGAEWIGGTASEGLQAIRDALLSDQTTLAQVAQELDVSLDTRSMAHVAHWVTPVVEPRRYDTHFLAVELPPGQQVTPDPREMTAAVWLSPAAALERFERGDLPMVFPTVKTLAMLQDHDTVAAVLEGARHRPVDRILPRLVRTESGVAIVVDDD